MLPVITVAHAWNGLASNQKTNAIVQVGWIGMTWTMYFTAKTIILDFPFPHWVYYLCAFSLLTVLIFLVPPQSLKKEWPQFVLFPLDLVRNFVDVVSYIRLFAVSYATLAVAMSFNEIAASYGMNTVWGGLVGALILFFGHTLNIALVALGILVHGVRLNVLEFSTHARVEWKGSPYRPFARSSP